MRRAVGCGAILAALAVAAGAWHAHGLGEFLVSLGRQDDLDRRLAWFETAARYQMYHALALAAVGNLAGFRAGALRAAAVLFVAGTLLFCGSLYAMTMLDASWRWLGAVTPLGGLALILGWLCVALAARGDASSGA